MFYEDVEAISDLMVPVQTVASDYSQEQPLADEIFETYRDQYSYDPTPLNPVVERVEDESERWIREKVSIDAAYDGKRFDVHVFLPRDIEPPYQTVVYFPGSGSVSTPSH